MVRTAGGSSSSSSSSGGVAGAGPMRMVTARPAAGIG
jgi:hypothetical protein